MLRVARPNITLAAKEGQRRKKILARRVFKQKSWSTQGSGLLHGRLLKENQKLRWLSLKKKIWKMQTLRISERQKEEHLLIVNRRLLSKVDHYEGVSSHSEVRSAELVVKLLGRQQIRKQPGATLRKSWEVSRETCCGWSHSSAGKSTCGSCQGPRFCSQHPQGSSQPQPVPGDLMPPMCGAPEYIKLSKSFKREKA